MESLKYGMTPEMVKFARRHIEKQRQYLETQEIISPNGTIKRLIDISFSANHSIRYYAQLSNKINTLHNLQFEIQSMPVFITATLDGYFRDFLSADFSRFFKKENYRDLLKKIPNNEKYGFLRDKVIQNEAFTIRDLYKVLLYQWNLFTKTGVFKKMRKANYEIAYVRTVEPHKKDGVPHFHVLLYVPGIFIPDIKKAFEKSFPAPRNRAPLLVGKPKRKCPLGQTYGFQWDLTNPVGYVLKYVTKTFRDVRSDKPLDELQSWFVIHKIPRVITSHSILPQWVYQIMMVLEQDWQILNDMARNGVAEWSIEDKYIYIKDIETGKWFEFDNGLYRAGYKDRIIKKFGEKKETVKKERDITILNRLCKAKAIDYETEEKTIVDYIPIEIDGMQGILNLHNNQMTLYKDMQKPVRKMSVLERFNYQKHLYDELGNPFNDWDDIEDISNKIYILEKYEEELFN